MLALLIWSPDAARSLVLYGGDQTIKNDAVDSEIERQLILEAIGHK